DQIVANEHACCPQVRRLKHREGVPAFASAGLAPRRTNLVVSANLLAVATEQKGGVVGFAIGLRKITAHDEIHVVPGSGGTEPLGWRAHWVRRTRSGIKSAEPPGTQGTVSSSWGYQTAAVVVRLARTRSTASQSWAARLKAPEFGRGRNGQ